MDGLRGRLAQEASIDARVAGAAYSALSRAFGEGALQVMRSSISQKLGDADRALFDTPGDFEKVIGNMTGEAAPLVLGIINGGLEREFGLVRGLDGRRLADTIEEIMVKFG
jgi:hypothetical protein